MLGALFAWKGMTTILSWAKIIIPILLCMGIFWAGKTWESSRHEKAVREQIQRSYEDSERERERVRKVNRRIKKHTEEQPIDYKRESCIFSNNPYETSCTD